MTEPDPQKELGRWAGLRDVLLGGLLLGIGVLTGGSALLGGHEAVDYFFDGLGLLLIAWGTFRLVRGR